MDTNTLDTIKQSVLHKSGKRFRKSRSNMIADLIRRHLGDSATYVIRHGNLLLSYNGSSITFNYRGTDIMRIGQSIEELNAEPYELTASTYYQRKSIRESVGEFIEYAQKTQARKKTEFRSDGTTEKTSEATFSTADDHHESEHRRHLTEEG